MSRFDYVSYDESWWETPEPYFEYNLTVWLPDDHEISGLIIVESSPNIVVENLKV